MKYGGLLIFCLLLLPGVASAHGIGEVYKLPIPLHYYLGSAAAAVALSFIGLAVWGKKAQPTTTTPKVISLPWLRPVVKFLRVVALVLLLLTIASGIFGTSDVTRNFAPVYFWIYFLLGYGLLSLFVGNLFEKINPWQTLGNWVGRSESASWRRVSPFVAPILLLALFWWELVSGSSFVPLTVGAVLLAYTFVSLILGRLTADWFADGELFAVFYRFVGTLSPLRISDDERGLVVLRPSQSLSSGPAGWSLVLLACVLLAGASFDSLKESVMWSNWLEAFGATNSSRIWAETVGIILSPLPFLFSYLGVAWLMSRLTGQAGKTFLLSRQFVWSLVPIAFGYTLAHNFSLMVVTAPLMGSLISDPFGAGWNLFGTAALGTYNVFLGAKAVWFIEIGLVVLAHIVGVWFAHILASKLFNDEKTVLKSQLPLMALMVGFTALTLWLLAAPLTIR